MILEKSFVTFGTISGIQKNFLYDMATSQDAEKSNPSDVLAL